MTPAAQADPGRLLSRVFPFYVECDRDLRIIASGEAMHRRYEGGFVGVLLPELCAIVSPAMPLTYDGLMGVIEQPVVMECRAAGLRYRGAFVETGAGNLLFLGSPSISVAEDIATHHIQMDEFAPWDQTPDLLLALQVQRAALEDARRLSAILSERTKQLAVANRDAAETAERLRSTLDNLVDAVFVVDARGIIERVNPAAERMFGYAPEQMVGQNVAMLMTDTYAAAHDAHLQAYLHGGEPRIIGIGREVEGRRSDGTVFPIELAVGRMEIGGEPRFTGVIRDISERKAAQFAIQESERFQRGCLDALSSRIAVVDECGLIIAVNRAWHEFAVAAGDPCDLCTGVNYLDVCDRAAVSPGDQPSRMAAGIRSVLACEREMFRMEYYMEAPDGLRWYDASVTRFSGDGPIRGVVTHTETTERVEAQHRMRLQAAALDQTSDRVSVVDLSGTILYLNDAGARDLGLAPGDVIGRSIDIFRSANGDTALPTDVVAQTVRDGASRTLAVKRTMDGRDMSLDVRLSCLLDDAGAPYAVCTVATDVTERLKADANVLLQAAALDQTADRVTVADLEGRVLFMNRAALASVGKSLADVVGQSVDIFGTDPGWGMTPRQIGEATVANGHFRTHLVKPDRDGRIITLDVRSTLLRDAAGTPYALCAVSADITERLEADDSMRRQATALDQSPVLVTVWDMSVRLVYVNAAAQAFLGLSQTEVAGRTGDVFRLDPSRGMSPMEMVARTIADGECRGDLYATRADGRPSVLEAAVVLLRDAEGTPSGFCSTAVDVTEQRALQAALRESDDRKSRMLDGALDAIVIMDADDVIVEFNPAAEAMFGYPADRAIGQDACTLLVPKERWREHRAVLERCTSADPGFPVTLRAMTSARRASGEVFPFSVAITGIHDGHRPLMMVFGEDATQQIAAQEALRQSADAIRTARERDVQTAARIQQVLLSTLPTAGLLGAEVASLATASQEVDGDYIDLIRHDAGLFDVVVGDVMGKGVQAALLAAATKSHLQRVIRRLAVALRPYARGAEPEEIVTALHTGLTPELASLDSFVTMCYARFDIPARRVRLVDCGHPRGIHYHRSTGECSFLEGGNLPLGFMPGEVYRQIDASFDEGDVFLFYSDGVTEASDATGNLFGAARVVDLLRGIVDRSPAEIAQAVKDAVIAYSGREVPSDDLTCVVVSVPNATGVAPRGRDAFEFRASLAELESVRNRVAAFAGREGGLLCEDDVQALLLAVNEAVVNVVLHAYRGEEGRSVQVDMVEHADRVCVGLYDWGEPFDRHAAPDPSFDGSRESGFGLFIIDQCVDEAMRTRDEFGRNLLLLTKRSADRV